MPARYEPPIDAGFIRGIARGLDVEQPHIVAEPTPRGYRRPRPTPRAIRRFRDQSGELAHSIGGTGGIAPIWARAAACKGEEKRGTISASMISSFGA